MRAGRVSWTILLAVTLTLGLSAAQQKPSKKGKAPAVPAIDQKLEVLKRDLAAEIDGMKDLTQQMVDSIFSFAEVGFQESETKRYCTDILKARGFTIDENVAGMPTAWTATWGSGKPVIALGSDVDGLLETSQKPGIPARAPFIDGAPGHGEGHNTGDPALDHGGARAQEDHGAREDPGHHQGLAGDCRGTAGRQGAVREGRRLQGRGRLPLLAHLVELRRQLG